MTTAQQATMREVLRSHWLRTIVCHHGEYPGDETWDRPECACSEIDFPKGKNVGEAVEMWINHVFVVAALEDDWKQKTQPQPTHKAEGELREVLHDVAERMHKEAAIRAQPPQMAETIAGNSLIFWAGEIDEKLEALLSQSPAASPLVTKEMMRNARSLVGPASTNPHFDWMEWYQKQADEINKMLIDSQPPSSPPMAQAGAPEAEASKVAEEFVERHLYHIMRQEEMSTKIAALLTTYARQRVLEAEQRCADWLRKQGHVLGAPGIANDMLAALRQSAEAGAGNEKA